MPMTELSHGLEQARQWRSKPGAAQSRPFAIKRSLWPPLQVLRVGGRPGVEALKLRAQSPCRALSGA
jgi:hypothetical protein